MISSKASTQPRRLIGLMSVCALGFALLIAMPPQADAEVLSFTVTGTTGLTKPTMQCVEYSITVSVPDSRPFRADTTIYMDLMGTGSDNRIKWWYMYPAAGATSYTYLASLCPSDLPSWYEAPFTLEVEVNESAGGGVYNRGFTVAPFTFVNDPSPTPTPTASPSPTATPTPTPTKDPTARPTKKCLRAKKQLRKADTSKERKVARKKMTRLCRV